MAKIELIIVDVQGQFFSMFVLQHTTYYASPVKVLLEITGNCDNHTKKLRVDRRAFATMEKHVLELCQLS